MIDDKKIEESAVESTNYLKGICDFTVINASESGFKAGAKWAINEFLKELFHPASEVPRNDNGKILAFSRELGSRKLYNMNAMLDKTTCNTYQEMWEEQVYMFRLSDWIFVDELFDLITKGGEQ
jgi:hypothetical protein